MFEEEIERGVEFGSSKSIQRYWNKKKKLKTPVRIHHAGGGQETIVILSAGQDPSAVDEACRIVTIVLQT